MLIDPTIGDIDQVETRVQRIVDSAVNGGDLLRLHQLWSWLRSAESRTSPGDSRERLVRMRVSVEADLARLGFSCGGNGRTKGEA
ncbi:hypothetical protein [Lysobacter niastensis]|uniref:Uncharacterized protein n=1 Tax=Lysobacter niastensis TaxID=380629 RepID=A0ABS0B556_9GAMM|nr:hypothetical protein [Lysobacter niastensis]MBF6023717.1 hypothetical protein [Lysobacter niastensis]